MFLKIDGYFSVVENSEEKIDINKVNSMPINAYKITTLSDLNIFLNTNNDNEYKFADISDCPKITIVVNYKKIMFIRDLFFQAFGNIAMAIPLKLLTNNINISDGVLYINDTKFVKSEAASVMGKIMDLKKFEYKKINDDYLNTFGDKIKKFIEKINVIKLNDSNNLTKIQFMESQNIKTFVLQRI